MPPVTVSLGWEKYSWKDGREIVDDMIPESYPNRNPDPKQLVVA
jgi:hypothetical protein